VHNEESTIMARIVLIADDTDTHPSGETFLKCRARIRHSTAASLRPQQACPEFCLERREVPAL